MTSIIVAGAVVLLLVALLKSRGATPGIDPDTARAEDLPALLMAGQKLAAIKVYRRLHGVDLKTAKEAVERLAAELLPRRRPDGSPE